MHRDMTRFFFLPCTRGESHTHTHTHSVNTGKQGGLLATGHPCHVRVKMLPIPHSFINVHCLPIPLTQASVLDMYPGAQSFIQMS